MEQAIAEREKDNPEFSFLRAVCSQKENIESEKIFRKDQMRIFIIDGEYIHTRMVIQIEIGDLIHLEYTNMAPFGTHLQILWSNKSFIENSQCSS